jgi:integrase
MDYHVFKKTVKGRSGRPAHRWYYYWIGPDGTQIQRVCRGCKNRSDAENYIRTLPPPAGSAPAGLTIPQKTEILIRDIAKNMYIPGSPHVGRRKQLGKSTDHETMTESRRYIKRIMELWGDLKLEALGVDVVMPCLFGLDYSGRWKNRFLEILGEIYTEAPWYDCRVSKPAFQRFAINSRKADIFTTAELDRLFKPENFTSYQFYLFFLLCLSGGMRIGEVRAVRAKQIIFDRKVLIIDGFCRNDGIRTVYNKKGSPENPKFRLVYLPELTLGKMRDWITENKIGPEDYCFTTGGGKPIGREWAEIVFYRALQTAGFIPLLPKREKAIRGEGQQKQTRARLKPPDGRKLVPHSLRYTYVSRMRRELTAAELQPMTGHTSIEMVDYYNRRVLDLALAALPDSALAAADTLFK